MKIIFASDIHGNEKRLEYIVSRCVDENADRLILSGDITGFFGVGISKTLQPVKSITSAVLGNCDNEGIVSGFGIGYDKDYGVFRADGFNIFYTHGHIYNENRLPPIIGQGDVLVTGHTHIPRILRKGGYLFLNPGSAAKPRGGFPPSFMTYDGEKFRITDFDGNTLFEEPYAKA